MKDSHATHGRAQVFAFRLLLLLCLLAFCNVAFLATGKAAYGAWSGGHDVTGGGKAGKTWYFAEGCTRMGFEEWVCLFNPNPETAIATCRYMLGDGQVLERDEALPPRSRVTVNVHGVVPPESDVSLAVESTAGIVAERPMYFRYRNAITGGH
ncbi:MAG: hypothetical protein QME88_03600, partial [Actinomycetota bacterium]|nr:hypothetical protein [Actinomycetota bacterium]